MIIKTVIRLHGFHVLVTGFVDVVNNITSKASCLMAQHIFSIFCRVSTHSPQPLCMLMSVCRPYNANMWQTEHFSIALSYQWNTPVLSSIFLCVSYGIHFSPQLKD